MKPVFSFGLAVLVLAPAGAQVFRPEAVNGALLGGVAGAVIGNNSGDLGRNGARGAAIGAAAGLLVGQAVGESNASRPAAGGPRVVQRAPGTVAVSVGAGRSHGWHRPHWGGRQGGGYRVGIASYPYHDPFPTYGYYPGYAVESYPHYGSYPERSFATDGLLLGALAGGIIGHNSGRGHGWRGAAIGAGAGWILGSLADSGRRTVVTDPAPAPAASPAAAPPAAAPVTIINNYHHTPASPMSSANGLFGR